MQRERMSCAFGCPVSYVVMGWYVRHLRMYHRIGGLERARRLLHAK